LGAEVVASGLSKQGFVETSELLQRLVVCCSVMQCIGGFIEASSALQFVAVLLCAARRCRVLQSVAEWLSFIYVFGAELLGGFVEAGSEFDGVSHLQRLCVSMMCMNVCFNDVRECVFR